MRSASWNPQLCLALASFLVGLFVPTGASGQVRIPEGAIPVAETPEAVFSEAEALEREGRWSELLSLLERARRQFPQDQRIQDQQVVARQQMDVRRRHADQSFIRLVSTTDMVQALQIYDEVLDKIQTYHVDAPRWDQLANLGQRTFLIACRCDEFHSAHRVRPSDSQVAALERQIQDISARFRVQDRRDLEGLVAAMASEVSTETGLPGSAVVMEYVCGATIALDWYSSFLTGDQYGEVMSQIDGNFVGLGVELKPHEDHLEILNVIANGPAGMGGMQLGDRIVAIDHITVTELGGNAAADRLRGPEGSKVVLSIASVGQEPREMVLERRRVEVPSVEQQKMIDPSAGVAYVKLASFQRTTREEMTRALWDLHRQGMQSLVIDLRGNPGGLLDAAVDVADLFLPAGTIVTTRGRNFDENRVHRARFEGTWRLPLVVLIDGDSASASEILAGALRDHRRATVVGERSYGKGSVQGIFALASCSAGIRLTTSKFYSPSGHAISDGGVEPDVPVSTQLAAVDSSNTPGDPQVVLRPDLNADPSLATAMRVATRQLQPLTP